MARPGRPKSANSKNLVYNFRMSEEEKQRLSQIAELTGMSKSACLREALSAYYKATENKEDPVIKIPTCDWYKQLFDVAKTGETYRDIYRKFLELTTTCERRLCEVDGKIGYFHCWEHFSKPVPAGLTIGSAPAGIISGVFGIVELTDGVHLVDPTDIKFCDEEHATLCMQNKYEKERCTNDKK